MRANSATHMAPQLERHLQNAAELMPGPLTLLRKGRASLHADAGFKDSAMCRSQLRDAIALIKEEFLPLYTAILRRDLPDQSGLLRLILSPC